MEFLALRAGLIVFVAAISMLYFIASDSKTLKGKLFQRYYRGVFLLLVSGFLFYTNTHLSIITGIATVLLPAFLGFIGMSVHNSYEYGISPDAAKSEERPGR